MQETDPPTGRQSSEQVSSPRRASKSLSRLGSTTRCRRGLTCFLPLCPGRKSSSFWSDPPGTVVRSHRTCRPPSLLTIWSGGSPLPGQLPPPRRKRQLPTGVRPSSSIASGRQFASATIRGAPSRLTRSGPVDSFSFTTSAIPRKWEPLKSPLSWSTSPSIAASPRAPKIRRSTR